MALLQCENVTFGYEGNPAIKNLNFNVQNGNYLCVVGENGSGKSTMMKGILGLIRPLTGTVEYGEGLKPTEIGYLPQQTAAQKDFPASVQEVVLSGRLSSRGIRPFYSRKDKEIVQQNLELMQITDLANQCYRELSGGQQQRVLLARALCATRRLLLLDEPVSGLDPVVTQNLYAMIEQINHETGITVIMISHDVQSAVKYASHILHLQSEQKFFGPTEEYLQTSIGQYFVRGHAE